MAAVTDRYTIEVMARQKGLKKLQKDVENVQKRLKGGTRSRNFDSMSEKITDMNGRIAQQTKQLQVAKLQTTKLGRAWEQSKMGVLGFNGALLSTLFFGMEMQRIFGGALKSIFQGYKKIIPESHQFNRMTTRLSANWEFFKFQLADALAQSTVFQGFIKFAIGLLSALQKLPQPMQALIGYGLILGAVLGALMLYIGIIGLGVAGIADGVIALGGASKLFSWGALGKVGIIAGVAAAIWGAKKALDAFYDSSEYGAKAQKDLDDAWTNTVNSVLGPLGDAFGNVNLRVDSFNEIMVVAGVVVHNAIIFFLQLVDLIILMGRTFLNVISLSMRPFIHTLMTLSEMILKVMDRDWKGALQAGKDGFSDFSDGVMKDINDLGNALDTFSVNFVQKSQSLKGFAPALEAYRQASPMSTQGGGDDNSTTNNIIVATPSELLAEGIITNETYETLLGAGKYGQELSWSTGYSN